MHMRRDAKRERGFPICETELVSYMYIELVACPNGMLTQQVCEHSANAHCHVPRSRLALFHVQ